MNEKTYQSMRAVFPQDPEIVDALRPGKEELDQERFEIIGESQVKLFISRQVLNAIWALKLAIVFRKSQPLGT